MPTYEFRLPDGTIIEQVFKMTEVPDEIPNPNGEGMAVRIISGGAALVFKGSGFYLTDYGKNAHRTQGDAPKSGTEGSAKEGSTKEGSGKEGSAKEGTTIESSAKESRPSEGKGESGGKSSSAEPKAAAAPAPKSDAKPSSGSGPAAP
jgi:predicted nucleic acid-binding Zn ribbon protein